MDVDRRGLGSAGVQGELLRLDAAPLRGNPENLDLIVLDDVALIDHAKRELHALTSRNRDRLEIQMRHSAHPTGFPCCGLAVRRRQSRRPGSTRCPLSRC